ncbi:DNA cytosine methyltransferase [Streptomyces griseoincarnatus]
MIVDLFAGPRGWSEGLRMLGLSDIGLEWDWSACKTAHAAGHPVIQCDVAQYPTAPFAGRIRGLIASPPCQAWSRAGKRGGLADQPLVHQAVHDLAHGRDSRAELLAQCKDERSLLAAEPMRWLYDLRPEWVCMEEVPDVLPLWKQYADVLRGWGYSVWTGTLDAADYGVPQRRERAVLLASRIRPVTAPPATHGDRHGHDLFGGYTHPWVRMSDALDLPHDTRVITRGDRKTPGGNAFPVDQPSWSVTGRARSWVLHTNRDQRADGSRQTIDPYTRPAPALTAKAGGQWKLRHDSGYERLLTVAEGALLQSFRPDYPFFGTKTKAFEQVGNAVPPLLAAHVVAAATGIAVRQALPAAA